MKKIIGSMILILVVSATAQAATIGFNPDDSFANLNEIFTVDIVGGGSFPETQGGGVNLFYDQTIINVLSVSIDNMVWNFVNDDGVTNNFAGTVSDILVSTFNSTGPDPSGSFIVATVSFQAIGLGVSSLGLTGSTINPWASAGSLRCAPWRAKRGRVVPGSREAILTIRRALARQRGGKDRIRSRRPAIEGMPA